VDTKSDALNLGLAHVRSEYVAFLDADVILKGGEIPMALEIRAGSLFLATKVEAKIVPEEAVSLLSKGWEYVDALGPAESWSSGVRRSRERLARSRNGAPRPGRKGPRRCGPAEGLPVRRRWILFAVSSFTIPKEAPRTI
jgi:glycosyltransferase involved in cell wall biosynthesis